MATDYFPLLKRAIGTVEGSSSEARHAIYDRARGTVESTLGSRTPPMPEPNIQAELAALEDAIWRMEMDLAATTPTEPSARAPSSAERSVDYSDALENMRYVRRILQPGERILARGKYHWIVYGESLLALIIGVLLFSLLPKTSAQDEIIGPLVLFSSIVLIGLSPILALRAWFNQWITEIAVTNLRVIHKSGFIRRRTWEMNMGKIESVTVDQSVPGRIFGYGTVHVMGTGAGTEHLHRIASPIEFRNRIVAR